MEPYLREQLGKRAAIRGMQITPDNIENLAKELGLNIPIQKQVMSDNVKLDENKDTVSTYENTQTIPIDYSNDINKLNNYANELNSTYNRISQAGGESPRDAFWNSPEGLALSVKEAHDKKIAIGQDPNLTPEQRQQALIEADKRIQSETYKRDNIESLKKQWFGDKQAMSQSQSKSKTKKKKTP